MNMDEKSLKELFKSFNEPFYWEKKPEKPLNKPTLEQLKKAFDGNS